jgi:GDP-mannose 6-dehydrogenase
MAELGHRVVAVDLDEVKVDRLNQGSPSIVENGLGELITKHVNTGALIGSTDSVNAAAEADLVTIAVGTPSLPSGEPDLRPLSAVCADLRLAFDRRQSGQAPLVVAVRSTVPPGTLAGLVSSQLSREGHREGEDYLVCSNPEFLREGSAIHDFMNPPMIVVGGSDPRTFALMRELYAGLDRDVTETTVGTSELIKYACNAYHALKICFANEIGTLSSELGVDGRKVMEIFCKDRDLNISEKYLRPGFSYGGSCLPKDVRALNAVARELHTDLPLLASIPRSNDAHSQRGIDIIHRFWKRRVGLFGLAFKAGTSDLRSSPMLDLLHRLQARKFEVLVHDDEVVQALEEGFYDEHLSHQLKACLRSRDEVLRHSEVAVIGKGIPEYDTLHQQLAADAVLVDLAGQLTTPPENIEYYSVCWNHPDPQGHRIARHAANLIEQVSDGAARAAGE